MNDPASPSPLHDKQATVIGASVLPLIALLLVGAFAAAPLPTTRAGLQTAQLANPHSTDTLREVGKMVFQVTNRARSARTLEPLEYEVELSDVACAHSGDMIQRDFFRHENPDGEGPSERVGRHHRRLIGEIGENILGQGGSALDSGEALANQIVEQWMDSPPHRENILRPAFTHLGVCVVRQENTIRATQVFARVRAYLASPLPHTGTPGDSITVEIERSAPSSVGAAKYDFWDPTAMQRAGGGPFAVTDGLGLPNREGTYRLRLYVPEAGRYTIHNGPLITITRNTEQR